LGTAFLLTLWTRLRRPVPAPRLIAVALVCLAALPRLDVLGRMWTPQREFALFRDGLARLDPSCRVITLIDVADAGFVPFEYLAPQGVIRDAAEFLRQPQSDDCIVYYRAGNCFTLDLVPSDQWSTFHQNATCRAVEQRYRLDPIIETQVPAIPYRGEIYTRDPLPLGFYRLVPVANEPATTDRTPG
jgi:hypothetical protein